MKGFKIYLLILVILVSYFQIAACAENEYGIAKAWFNEQNATVNGIKLKIGEPVEIRVEVISKINGNVHVILGEPGTTLSYEVISGPSKQDDRIDNMGVSPNWSKIFQWKIRPNGAWTNGNAPINIFVSFYNSKKKDQKSIHFTIANPYILDEQYSGAVPTPENTASQAGTQAKAAPFLPGIFAVGALFMVWRWRREESNDE